MPLTDLRITEGIKNWLLNSGVWNSVPGSPVSFSFNNGYHWKDRKYGYVYNEITGYGVSFFVYLYSLTANEEYLRHAQKTAQYLLSIQNLEKNGRVYGSFPYAFRWPQLELAPQYYVFDNFIIIQGLLDLYVATGKSDHRLLNSAQLSAAWIITQLHESNDGSFYSRYDDLGGSKKYPTSNFPGDRGALHGKIAIAFLKLWSLTGDDRYRSVAIKALEFAMGLQQDDGSFWANIHQKYVFSHAQCYVTEGLAYAYTVLGDDRYKAAWKQSLDFLNANMQDDGGLKHIYHDKKFFRRVVFSLLPFETTDATSQYLRLVVLFAYNSGDPSLLEHYRANKAAKYLVGQQIDNEKNRSIHGALWHKSIRRIGKDFRSPVISTWCSQFSYQALEEFENCKDLKRERGTMFAGLLY